MKWLVLISAFLVWIMAVCKIAGVSDKKQYKTLDRKSDADECGSSTS